MWVKGQGLRGQKCKTVPFSILLSISHSDSNFHKLFCMFEYDTTTDFVANGSIAKVSRSEDMVSESKVKFTRSYMLNSTPFVILQIVCHQAFTYHKNMFQSVGQRSRSQG